MDTRIPSSIFNNVLGPVMRGPSSSHTAAAVRIGKLAIMLLGEDAQNVTFTFDKDGSLASTFRGQGSAMGLAAGLLEMEMTDPEIIRAEERCKQKSISISYKIENTGDSHPNSYNVEARGRSGKIVSFIATSTGGGIVRLIKLNGKDVEDDFDYINPLMPVKLISGAEDSLIDIQSIDLTEKKLSDMALDYESAISGLSREDVFSMAFSHLAIIKDSIDVGLEGTDYKDRILHRQSHLISKVPEKGDLIPAWVVNRIIQSVTAIMETKSSMGVIVAAPTAGSAGTIGGVLVPVADICGRTENETASALLSAGLIGLFISRGAGFAAEEGGCQYECGSASGMAAAALVELMGGSGQMAMNAASMALQNTMGMICDPVANRVEVPCLGKNIMASLNALAAANMTIAGFDHVIPLDEVIKAMKEVGDGMDRKFRCTCAGGLSTTNTARKLDSTINR